MSDEAWETFIGISLLLIFGLFILSLAIMDTGVMKKDYKAICEGKGGVYLDRTYQSGKFTKHIYTCVRRDSIIDMEN